MRLLPIARRATALFAATALGFSVSACTADADESGAAGGSETVVFTADNGEIEIPSDPERVIATGYAVPVLLEADAPLVGISEWSRGLPMMTEEDLATYEATDKIMGETADSISYDAVEQAEPDLIILGVPLRVLGDVNMERLEQIAPVVVLGPSLPDSWKELGGRQSEAAGVLGNWDAQKEAYYAKAAELEDEYADVLDGVDFGHLGAYGDVTAGEFHREYAGSYATHIAGDIGVNYYGQVRDGGAGGAAEVSEFSSIEELPRSFGEADYITYTVNNDGSISEEVQYVMDSPLWRNLPAVRAGHVIPIRYSEAATYQSALMTLDALDAALASAFAEELR